ncbi:hypothetical protein N836_26180 [Leptolyngbya sp. Heron Island J]|uniref:DUF2949 domain-containing protein n=1 Tax=Leptolyngbya sp. Heron Island J TaxID=1385935 RepID=UPI0003B9884D|nr:DUF2949 domain-containing protein [Leptolyngbya sp. Heron Island J]ESA32415.1 hypothetical protein N836_26180 [Leptolyngbya sp. Heron Island J]
MQISLNTPLLQFLQDELAVPEKSIASALQQSDQDTSLFPIVLWQHGLITFEQLDQAFDLLAKTYGSSSAIP